MTNDVDLANLTGIYVPPIERVMIDTARQSEDGYWKCPEYGVSRYGGGLFHHKSGCPNSDSGYDNCVYYIGKNYPGYKEILAEKQRC